VAKKSQKLHQWQPLVAIAVAAQLLQQRLLQKQDKQPDSAQFA
jgi:hypothetical protein